MQHLKKFNESEEKKQTLRDLIGDVKETKKIGYRNIIETTKGCFSSIEFYDEFDDIDWLDSEVTINNYGDGTGEILLKHTKSKWANHYYVYLEGDIPKIISDFPGDERGCILFGDVFIVSGHDGNYLWNVKTGEFKSNTW